jgi:hypothetical protein
VASSVGLANRRPHETEKRDLALAPDTDTQHVHRLEAAGEVLQAAQGPPGEPAVK